jgi:hypothetical protein
MKRVFLACLLLIPMASALGQETATPEALPTADSVVDKYIEASGGKAALEKVTTRVYKGSFDLPSMGATGTWERFEKAPDKGVTIVDVPGWGVITNSFDGTAAWEDNPMVGMTDKTGVALARAKLDSVFHKELRLRELYKVTLKGKEKVGTRDAYLVEATPPAGGTEKLYFDVENGLLVRLDAEREGPQGPAMMETYLEDYKEVEGVKLPFTMRQKVGEGFEILLKVTEVKFNTEVDDARFAKPAPKPAAAPTPAPKP